MSADNSTEGGALNNATFQTSGGGSPTGLVLDLSKVQQENQSGAEEVALVTAYRERVVPGSDDGAIQSFRAVDAGRVGAVTSDTDASILLEKILFESRMQTAALIRLFNTLTDETISRDHLATDLESNDD